MNKEIAIGIVISLLFISLVILFCAILIKLYIQKIKKYNAQIYENEISFHKTLNASILETQEQLLNTISQDLHDDAGQQLTVINFQLENLKLDQPNCEKSLTPISKSVENLSQTLRQISHSLNSNWLEKKGFFGAIQHEVNRLKKIKMITVIYNCNDTKKKFKKEEQIVLFRIVQETLNNILKHSKASKIEIDITFIPIFEIKIKDNGIGFDFEQISKSTNSMGIENCFKRAELVNFTYLIESKTNQGSTFILKENQNL